MLRSKAAGPPVAVVPPVAIGMIEVGIAATAIAARVATIVAAVAVVMAADAAVLDLEAAAKGRGERIAARGEKTVGQDHPWIVALGAKSPSGRMKFLLGKQPKERNGIPSTKPVFGNIDLISIAASVAGAIQARPVM